MNIEDYARELRKLVGIADAIETDAILDLIKKEGWEPNLICGEVDGREVWGCPMRNEIGPTIERNDTTGQMGQEQSPTPEIAALQGLRKARGKPRLSEAWEYEGSPKEKG